MDKKYHRYFGEKKQDKTKCRNIIEYDFVNEIASNIAGKNK